MDIRERIKGSHVRLFKIHAKFERERKKKSRGEDGIRTKIARAAGSTKEKIKGRISGSSIVPEKRRRKKKKPSNRKKNP